MATDTVMAAGTAMATSTTLAAEKSSAAEAAFRNFGSRNSFRSYRALAAGIAEPVGKCRKNQLFISRI